MPTEDDFAGTGYFKGTDAVIGVNHNRFWTPERKKLDLQFLLVGMAAVALLIYFGKR